MAIALLGVLKFTFSLDAVLVARSDINSEPFTGMSERRSPSPSTTFLGKAKNTYESFSLWIKEKLEIWTAPKGDRQVAWILGIGWACCGGGLAGGCLVFAKATYVPAIRITSRSSSVHAVSNYLPEACRTKIRGTSSGILRPSLQSSSWPSQRFYRSYV